MVNTSLGDNPSTGLLFARLIVDYAFPTRAQKRFVRAFKDVVSVRGILGHCNNRDTRNIQAIARISVIRECLQFPALNLRLRNNKPVVLDAVSRNGFLLKYASLTLRSDRDVAIAAARQCPCALKLADKTLQDDPEVRREAGITKWPCCRDEGYPCMGEV